MPGSTLPDFLADGHVHASAAASHDAAGSATATAPASASVRLDNLNWTADETAIGGTAENWDALQAENIRLVLFIFDEKSFTYNYIHAIDFVTNSSTVNCRFLRSSTDAKSCPTLLLERHKCIANNCAKFSASNNSNNVIGVFRQLQLNWKVRRQT